MLKRSSSKLAGFGRPQPIYARQGRQQAVNYSPAAMHMKLCNIFACEAPRCWKPNKKAIIKKFS